MQHQLPLEFIFNNEFTFDSFVTGSNDELVQSLKNLSSIDDVPFLYFWGKSGVGKSHLLQAICQSPAFKNKPVAMIPLDSSELYSAEMLEGLEKLSLVCVDSVQCIVGISEWENALFHFYNRARDLSTPLVMCGDCPPANLAFKLQDLKTRLGWGLVLQLQGISDDKKLLAIQSRATIRGIELTDEVGRFLLSRYSREMTALIALLDRLDKASLMEQRRLTIPFVKQFMGNSCQYLE